MSHNSNEVNPTRQLDLSRAISEEHAHFNSRVSLLAAPANAACYVNILQEMLIFVHQKQSALEMWMHCLRKTSNEFPA